jgi:hypothetical protein
MEDYIYATAEVRNTSADYDYSTSNLILLKTEILVPYLGRMVYISKFCWYMEDGTSPHRELYSSPEEACIELMRKHHSTRARPMKHPMQ